MVWGKEVGLRAEGLRFEEQGEGFGVKGFRLRAQD